MAEDAEEFEGEEPEFGSAGGRLKGFIVARKKLLLLIVLPAVLVIGGAATAYFTGLAAPLLSVFGGKSGAESAGAEAAPVKDAAKEKEKKAVPTAEAVMVWYDLPDILVNINAPGRVKSFLKLKVTLELNSEIDTEHVSGIVPHIIDNFQLYLRDLKPDDLSGAAGVFRLREELLKRVNAAVRPVQVKDVLFKEFIVQ